MRRAVMPLVVPVLLAACSDRPSPVAPTVARVATASASRGSAPSPIDISFELEACGFPTLVRIFGKEKAIEHPNGRLVVLAPSEAVTLTNLDTDASITLGITGTIRVTFLDNGNAELNLTGRSVFERENGLFLTIGNWNATIDPVGNEAVPLNGTGQLINLCDLID